MTSKAYPVKRRSPVVVEWMYVRYRTLLVLAGLLMIAVALGVWGWQHLMGSITEAQASRAIAAAEQSLSKPSASVPGPICWSRRAIISSTPRTNSRAAGTSALTPKASPPTGWRTS